MKKNPVSSNGHNLRQQRTIIGYAATHPIPSTVDGSHLRTEIVRYMCKQVYYIYIYIFCSQRTQVIDFGVEKTFLSYFLRVFCVFIFVSHRCRVVSEYQNSYKKYRKRTDHSFNNKCICYPFIVALAVVIGTEEEPVPRGATIHFTTRKKKSVTKKEENRAKNIDTAVWFRNRLVRMTFARSQVNEKCDIRLCFQCCWK